MRIMSAYYGPQSAQARANVLSEISGDKVSKSHKSVQWGNWFDRIAWCFA